MRRAVDIHAEGPRPAPCRCCGIPFSSGELTVCAWVAREASRWNHTSCVAGKIPPAAELSVVGQAAQEHLDAARRALAEGRVGSESATDDTPSRTEGGMLHDEWQHMRLPEKEWWASLSWDSVLRVGFQTFVQIPDRWRGAYAAARKQNLEVLTKACNQGEAEAEWKAFILFDALLLSRDRGGATCAEMLEERLALWSGGQWAALLESARGSTSPPGRATGKASDKKRAARVHALAAAGEQGRALAALAASPPAPRTADTLQKLRELFPEASQQQDPAPQQPGGFAPITEEFRSEVEANVMDLLRKARKLSAPGLLGCRLEHLSVCKDNAEASDMLAKAIARIVLGEAPPSLIRALRTGELVALSKDAGDVRLLLVGATLRRLGLRVLVRARRQQLAEAVGPRQYGVGRPDGAGLLYRSLLAQSELRPNAVFIKADASAAFQRMERGPAFNSMMGAIPEVGAALRVWCEGPVEHFWRDAAGIFEQVRSSRGFDQGCPLAPGFFAMGVKKALGPFITQLAHLDRHARVYSYLDDIYIVVESSLAPLALTALQRALGTVGLDLNPTKTMVWSPGGVQAVPAELQAHWVNSLPCLGAKLRSPGEEAESPVQLGETSGSLRLAGERLAEVWAGLLKMHKAGLPRQAMAALLRTYAGPASQHALRLQQSSDDDTQAYDAQLAAIWSQLLERPLDDAALARLGLPSRMGGCGVQWAQTRRHAAFLAGWTSALEFVGKDTGHSTVADCLDALPSIASKLEVARSGLASQGVVLSQGASLADALRHSRPQRLLVDMMQKTNLAALTQSLHPSRAAALRSGGGPGGGAFLLYPIDVACTIEDTFWSCAVRHRLGMNHAECSQAELPLRPTTCQCRPTGGALCTKELDASCFHASVCQAGGGVVRRHNRLAKVVGSLITRWCSEQPLREQRVPHWDRQRSEQQVVANPTIDPLERAILDLEYHDGSGRKWIDVSIRHPAAGDAAAVGAAARRDGEAARRGERDKHLRYPGAALVPFVVEVFGRVGGEAREWLRSLVAVLPEDMQSSELALAYRMISCAVQAPVARQLRASSGLR
jgi:hypothetical protein